MSCISRPRRPHPLIALVPLLAAISALPGEDCFTGVTCVIPDDTPTKSIQVTIETGDGKQQTIELNSVCIASTQAKGAKADTGYYAAEVGCGVYKVWNAGEKKWQVPDPNNMAFCGPLSVLELIPCPAKP